ncbi:MAG: type II toxin-antitoxin system PemK/MazF family toxin, partial [Pyrinomonadaceae bacterium]
SFPFSDLSRSKRRPALVLANLAGSDVILCMITSGSQNPSIRIDHSDFRTGGLPAWGNVKNASYVRPCVIFTADSRTVDYPAIGWLKTEKINEVIQELTRILSE